jgi:hypothetical protein
MMARPWPASGWNRSGFSVPVSPVLFRVGETAAAELRHMGSTVIGMRWSGWCRGAEARALHRCRRPSVRRGWSSLHRIG